MLAANKLTRQSESLKTEASVIQMTKDGVSDNQTKKSESGVVKSWATKLMFTLISIKTWGIVGAMAVSTWLLNQSLISGATSGVGLTGTQWITFNTTIWTMLRRLDLTGNYLSSNLRIGYSRLWPQRPWRVCRQPSYSMDRNQNQIVQIPKIEAVFLEFTRCRRGRS